MKPILTFALFAVAACAPILRAHAGILAGLGADADVDPRFRAKLVKEKIKTATETNGLTSGGRDGHDANVACGSQSIGNVDTGGQIGRVPREVFVFAPNAINFVDGRGCR
jgi:hypothetical protein